MKTKFNLKILLLVAILLITMCLFNTNMVQATDVTAEETKTPTEEMEEKISKLIPNTISLDITESETLAELEKSKEGDLYTYSCTAINLVSDKFDEILKANNITLPLIYTENSQTVTVDYGIGGFVGAGTYEAQWDMSNVDIHTVCIWVSETAETGGSHASAGGETEMKINIKYADTDNSEILNSLTDTITLDMKESEVDLNIESGYNNLTLSKIKEAINKQLTDKGYDVSNLEIWFTENSGFEPIDIHKVIVNIGNSSKEIKINYSNTSQYNETDATYVKNKVNSIKFANYGETDAVFTIYNLGDEENANKWNENTYDFSKLLNDNSIVLKRTLGAGGTGGGTPWGYGTILYFYKNDVLYAAKFIMNMGMYGITLDNGTPVNMARLEKDDEIYKEMAKELEKNGLKNIIGCYELTAYGTTYKDMEVSFNIGTNYNGKEVKILHKKSNNTYDTLTAKVENGKATIKVDEFSPFMIALNDTTTTRALDNEPKTGVVDYTIFASVIALISLGGIAILKFKK